ncbi:Fic family protein [Nitratireductor sp. PBL-C9]|uniref:Fic family protein n=1 Tax=Nitratireductor sp. PBL-C9 TaxID=3435013 RepID=UPI003D7DBC25
MAELSLETLLARASSHSMTRLERREQEMSLIVGNTAVEGLPLHRGTVTIALTRVLEPSPGTVATTVGSELPNVPFDVSGAVRQFKLVTALVERHLTGEIVQITPELIKKLHATTGDETSPYFGTFRAFPVAIQGSSHQPPSPANLDQAVTALCDYLADRWKTDDAFTLSAYALWRLNWIHPFLDGNGRTARALSYLILNLKLDMLLPGSPTLLEQLKERRDDYFHALTVADLSFDNGGTVDLSVLKDLLATLLRRQLLNLPALSGSGEKQIAAIVTRRIGQLDASMRERLFGANELAHRVWAVGDYLLVHVGSHTALEQSEALFATASQPFPGLLAAPRAGAQLTVTAKQRGAIIKPRTFEVAGTAGLWLEPNASATVERPAVALHRPGTLPLKWQLDGALYVLRRGHEITDLWTHDVFDLLVMRHIQGAR